MQAHNDDNACPNLLRHFYVIQLPDQVNKIHRPPTNVVTAEDSNSLVSEDNDIENTDDTSYLEHRELTPLLSSDTESVDVFDTTSLPGDPVRVTGKLCTQRCQTSSYIGCVSRTPMARRKVHASHVRKDEAF